MEDTLKTVFPKEKCEVTKRNILTSLAKIYYPLGVVSQATLTGKLIYRDVCDLKLAWDTAVPNQLNCGWMKWVEGLVDDVEFN